MVSVSIEFYHVLTSSEAKLTSKDEASYDIFSCFFAVRSYGTEHRAAEKKVGPRSEVYEYIVFRGTDIKDLHVSKAPKSVDTVNQDPSILQVGENNLIL